MYKATQTVKTSVMDNNVPQIALCHMEAPLRVEIKTYRTKAKTTIRPENGVFAQ
jgi:hypothetical protein